MNTMHTDLKEKLKQIKLREEAKELKSHFMSNDNVIKFTPLGLTGSDKLANVRDWGRWYGHGRDEKRKQQLKNDTDSLYIQTEDNGVISDEIGVSTLGLDYVNQERDALTIFYEYNEGDEKVDEDKSIAKVRCFIAKEILGIEGDINLDSDDGRVVTFLLENFNQTGIGSVIEAIFMAPQLQKHNTEMGLGIGTDISVMTDKDQKKTHLKYNRNTKSLTITEECHLTAIKSGDAKKEKLGEMSATASYTIPLDNLGKIKDNTTNIVSITPTNFNVTITHADRAFKNLDKREVGKKIKEYVNIVLEHFLSSISTFLNKFHI